MATVDSVTIRIATPQDIPEIIRLERQCPTAAHWTEQQYASLLDAPEGIKPRLTLIAERTDSPELGKQIFPLFGFLVARQITSEWELENIVVGPESRGKGIGTRLLRELLTHAKQANGEGVFLEVRESNVVARALYEKLGFQQTGRRKSYYANPIEDAVLYLNQLRPFPTPP